MRREGGPCARNDIPHLAEAAAAGARLTSVPNLLEE